MKRSVAVGFWLLFAVQIALHVWIGDVVVGTQRGDGTSLFLLRGNPETWIRVSPLTYWLHLIAKYAMGVACLAAAGWALWQWMYDKDFKSEAATQARKRR